MMGLTDKQIEEVFELLKLASSEQRADFLSHLSFLAFNERLGSGDVIYDDPWPNGEQSPRVTIKGLTFVTPPKRVGRLIRVTKTTRGSPPILDPDDLEGN